MWFLGRRSERNRIDELVKEAGSAFDAGEYGEAARLTDSILEAARRAKLGRDLVALPLVIRSAAMQKLGKKDEALKSAVDALGCMCSVRNGATQLAIFDQAGGAMLDCHYDRQSILLLEAAISMGAADRDPLHTSARLERAGLAYLRVGAHAKSIAAFAKAIEIVTQERGADDLGLANIYINLGNGYKRMQKIDDAERCYREALRLFELNGETRPEHFSTVLLNLGVACSETGRDGQAEQYYRQVLDIRIKAFGRNDWRVGNTYNNLASCRRRARDFEKAEEYLKLAIEILEPRPESLCHAIESLSRLREDQGRMEEALAETTRARELQQSMVSPDLSQLATFFDRESMLAVRLGETERAAECRTKASQLRQALASAQADPATGADGAIPGFEETLHASLRFVKALQQTV